MFINIIFVSRLILPKESFKNPKGPFKNYLNKILTMFDYLPTSKWSFFTLNVDKKKHFLASYPPHLVHVVFERPLGLFAKLWSTEAITL